MVATKPIDFRKGHDSLAAMVKNELRKDPFPGTIFVFRAKKGVDDVTAPRRHQCAMVGLRGSTEEDGHIINALSIFPTTRSRCRC
jgi:hypothetical protein